MVLNAQTLQVTIMMLLPVPIALIAGILRQDRFNPLINEIISQAIVFLVALLSFLLGVGGHLTGNPQVDFLALVAYCGWLSNQAPFKPLHLYLQTNLLSLGLSKAAQVEQTGLADIKAAVDRLNAFFEGASQNPPPAVAPQVALAHTQTVIDPAEQLPFPTNPMTFEASTATNTYPLAAIQVSQMPQPPRG